ncbi:hypothetical protein C8R43DRAFT_956838 [Mycena crocata]|nr:hypothetical protein C8R43DRAFT_956838 [Mycena crocata]
MCIIRLPILWLAALWFDRSLIPPNVPSSLEQERTDVYRQQLTVWFDRTIVTPLLPTWTRVVFWAFTMTETLLIVADYFCADKPSSAVLLLGAAPPQLLMQASTTLMLGIALIVSGATLRFRCFRELGHNYTFALSLRTGHTLVTSGPYGVVRHPAYSGTILTLSGAVLAFMGGGSWWFGSGQRSTWGILLAVNLIGCVGMHGFVVARAFREDVYLRTTFGEKWERYAARVPYRYIPGVC